MECINRSMEMKLLADAMIRKLEQGAQAEKAAVQLPEIHETRTQRRARERAEKKAEKRVAKQKVEVA